MLKMTKVEFKKEQGIRSGISYINKRYSEASKDVHIFYQDMNNLYGCAMRQYFPISDSKWVKNINEIEQISMRIKSNRFRMPKRIT